MTARMSSSFSTPAIGGMTEGDGNPATTFAFGSKIDSRTIIDQSGAEQLLGHGDMLYLPPGTGTPVRVHGAFVDDHVSWSLCTERGQETCHRSR